VRARRRHRALRGTGVVVFLDADLATLAARVRAADRPRVNADASLEEDLAAIWASAEPLYRAADLTYRTDGGLPVDDEVVELAALLRARGV
jgi:shikimate kinase